ncbi:HEAT repeat domain-containing protein, partial [Thermoproteota archaeon]
MLQSKVGVRGVSRTIDAVRMGYRLTIFPFTYAFITTEYNHSGALNPEHFYILRRFKKKHGERMFEDIRKMSARFGRAAQWKILGLVISLAYEIHKQNKDVRDLLEIQAPVAIEISQDADEVEHNLGVVQTILSGKYDLQLVKDKDRFKAVLVKTGSEFRPLEAEAAVETFGLLEHRLRECNYNIVHFYDEVFMGMSTEILSGALDTIFDLIRYGIFPTETLINLAKASDDRSGLCRQWQAEAQAIRAGGFDPRNSLHVELEYSTFRRVLDNSRIVSDKFKKMGYGDYLAMLRKKSKSDDAVSAGEKAELIYAAYEARLVKKFIDEVKARAFAMGRDVWIIPNLSYGRFATVFIEEDLRLEDTDIFFAKIGSSETHENPYYINPRFLRSQVLNRMVRDRPVIIVIDGSFHTDRYPDAHQAYINLAIALNDVISKGDTSSYSDMVGRSRGFISSLRKRSDFGAVCKILNRAYKENGQPRDARNLFSFHLWNPRGVKLKIRSSWRTRRGTLGKPAPMEVDDLTGPSIIFVNSVVTDKDVPESVKVKAGGVKHKPASFDDNSAISITNLLFRVDETGIHLSDRMHYLEMHAARSLAGQKKRAPVAARQKPVSVREGKVVEAARDSLHSNAPDHNIIKIRRLSDELEDRNAKIRADAAHSLGEFVANEGVATALRNQLRGEKNAEVQYWIISSLGTIGARDACRDVARVMLANNTTTNVRSEAARALGALEGAGHVDELARVITICTDVEVKKEALLALRKIRTPETLPIMLEALQEEKDAGVRAVAGEAYLDIGREDAVAEAIRCFEDKDPSVRSILIEGIGDLGDKRAVAAIAQPLTEDRSPVVREKAAWALGIIGDVRALVIVQSALKTERDKDVRAMLEWAEDQLGQAAPAVPEPAEPKLEEARPTAGKAKPSERIIDLWGHRVDVDKIRAFIMDLDGTLALLGQALLPDVVEFIIGLLNQGDHIMITTLEREENLEARVWAKIPPELRKNLHFYSNAGTVGFGFDEHGNKVIYYRFTLDEADRQRILGVVNGVARGRSYNIKPASYKVKIKFGHRMKKDRHNVAQAVQDGLDEEGLRASVIFQGTSHLNVLVLDKVSATRDFISRVGLQEENLVVVDDSAHSFGSGRRLLTTFKRAVSINVGGISPTIAIENPNIIQPTDAKNVFATKTVLRSVRDARASSPTDSGNKSVFRIITGQDQDDSIGLDLPRVGSSLAKIESTFRPHVASGTIRNIIIPDWGIPVFVDSVDLTELMHGWAREAMVYTVCAYAYDRDTHIRRIKRVIELGVKKLLVVSGGSPFPRSYNSGLDAINLLDIINETGISDIVELWGVSNPNLPIKAEIAHAEEKVQRGVVRLSPQPLIQPEGPIFDHYMSWWDAAQASELLNGKVSGGLANIRGSISFRFWSHIVGIRKNGPAEFLRVAAVAERRLRRGSIQERNAQIEAAVRRLPNRLGIHYAPTKFTPVEIVTESSSPTSEHILSANNEQLISTIRACLASDDSFCSKHNSAFAARGLTGPRLERATERVLEAFRQVPRYLFMPEELRESAHEDRTFSIGHGQTISQPSFIAKMLILLDLGDTDRILEIGAGCGWFASLLAQLCGEVYTMEIIPQLATSARERIRSLEYKNITVIGEDGSFGYADAAPFDGVVISAGPLRIPDALVEQLKVGGRLMAPINPRGDDRKGYDQFLHVKNEGGALDEVADLGPCGWVDFTGAAGHPRKEQAEWKVERSSSPLEQGIPENLNDMIKMVIRSFHDFAARRKVTVHLQEHATDVMGWDAPFSDRLARYLVLSGAFFHVLQNAIKYSYEEGAVIVTIERKGRSTIVIVEDKGIGIAPEDIPHVFELKFRAKNAKAYRKGKGVGLSKVFKIVGQYPDVSFDIESEGEGKGTTATFAIRPASSSPTAGALQGVGLKATTGEILLRASSYFHKKRRRGEAEGFLNESIDGFQGEIIVRKTGEWSVYPETRRVSFVRLTPGKNIITAVFDKKVGVLFLFKDKHRITTVHSVLSYVDREKRKCASETINSKHIVKSRNSEHALSAIRYWHEYLPDGYSRILEGLGFGTGRGKDIPSINSKEELWGAMKRILLARLILDVREFYRKKLSRRQKAELDNRIGEFNRIDIDLVLVASLTLIPIDAKSFCFQALTPGPISIAAVFDRRVVVKLIFKDSDDTFTLFSLVSYAKRKNKRSYAHKAKQSELEDFLVFAASSPIGSLALFRQRLTRDKKLSAFEIYQVLRDELNVADIEETVALNALIWDQQRDLRSLRFSYGLMLEDDEAETFFEATGLNGDGSLLEIGPSTTIFWLVAALQGDQVTLVEPSVRFQRRINFMYTLFKDLIELAGGSLHLIPHGLLDQQAQDQLANGSGGFDHIVAIDVLFGYHPTGGQRSVAERSFVELGIVDQGMVRGAAEMIASLKRSDRGSITFSIFETNSDTKDTNVIAQALEARGISFQKHASVATALWNRAAFATDGVPSIAGYKCGTVYRMHASSPANQMDSGKLYQAVRGTLKQNIDLLQSAVSADQDITEDSLELLILRKALSIDDLINGLARHLIESEHADALFCMLDELDLGSDVGYFALPFVAMASYVFVHEVELDVVVLELVDSQGGGFHIFVGEENSEGILLLDVTTYGEQNLGGRNFTRIPTSELERLNLRLVRDPIGWETIIAYGYYMLAINFYDTGFPEEGSYYYARGDEYYGDRIEEGEDMGESSSPTDSPQGERPQLDTSKITLGSNLSPQERGFVLDAIAYIILLRPEALADIDIELVIVKLDLNVLVELLAQQGEDVASHLLDTSVPEEEVKAHTQTIAFLRELIDDPTQDILHEEPEGEALVRGLEYWIRISEGCRAAWQQYIDAGQAESDQIVDYDYHAKGGMLLLVNKAKPQDSQLYLCMSEETLRDQAATIAVGSHELVGHEPFPLLPQIESSSSKSSSPAQDDSLLDKREQEMFELFMALQRRSVGLHERSDQSDIAVQVDNANWAIGALIGLCEREIGFGVEEGGFARNATEHEDLVADARVKILTILQTNSALTFENVRVLRSYVKTVGRTVAVDAKRSAGRKVRGGEETIVPLDPSRTAVADSGGRNLDSTLAATEAYIEMRKLIKALEDPMEREVMTLLAQDVPIKEVNRRLGLKRGALQRHRDSALARMMPVLSRMGYRREVESLLLPREKSGRRRRGASSPAQPDAARSSSPSAATGSIFAPSLQAYRDFRESRDTRSLADIRMHNSMHFSAFPFSLIYPDVDLAVKILKFIYARTVSCSNDEEAINQMTERDSEHPGVVSFLKEIVHFMELAYSGNKEAAAFSWRLGEIAAQSLIENNRDKIDRLSKGDPLTPFSDDPRLGHLPVLILIGSNLIFRLMSFKDREVVLVDNSFVVEGMFNRASELLGLGDVVVLRENILDPKALFWKGRYQCVRMEQLAMYVSGFDSGAMARVAGAVPIGGSIFVSEKIIQAGQEADRDEFLEGRERSPDSMFFRLRELAQQGNEWEYDHEPAIRPYPVYPDSFEEIVAVLRRNGRSARRSSSPSNSETKLRNLRTAVATGNRHHRLPLNSELSGLGGIRVEDIGMVVVADIVYTPGRSDQYYILYTKRACDDLQRFIDISGALQRIVLEDEVLYCSRVISHRATFEFSGLWLGRSFQKGRIIVFDELRMPKHVLITGNHSGLRKGFLFCVESGRVEHRELSYGDILRCGQLARYEKAKSSCELAPWFIREARQSGQLVGTIHSHPFDNCDWPTFPRDISSLLEKGTSLHIADIVTNIGFSRPYPLGFFSRVSRARISRAAGDVAEFMEQRQEVRSTLSHSLGIDLVGERERYVEMLLMDLVRRNTRAREDLLRHFCRIQELNLRGARRVFRQAWEALDHLKSQVDAVVRRRLTKVDRGVNFLRETTPRDIDLIARSLTSSPIVGQYTKDGLFYLRQEDLDNIVGDVSLGRGSSIWPWARFEAHEGAQIKAGSIIAEDNARIIAPEGLIHAGKKVTVAHSAVVEGAGIFIADGVMVGMGAKVLAGAKIGTLAYIVAGAVVPPGFKVAARHKFINPDKVVPYDPQELVVTGEWTFDYYDRIMQPQMYGPDGNILDPYIHPSATISETAVITGDFWIDACVHIGDMTSLHSEANEFDIHRYARIGNYCVIHVEPARLICPYTGKLVRTTPRGHIGESAILADGVCSHADHIGANAFIGEGCVLTPHTKVGEWATLSPDTVLKEGQQIRSFAVASGKPAREEYFGEERGYQINQEQRKRYASRHMSSPLSREEVVGFTRHICDTYAQFMWEKVRGSVRQASYFRENPRWHEERVQDGGLCQEFSYILAKVLNQLLHLLGGDSQRAEFRVEVVMVLDESKGDFLHLLVSLYCDDEPVASIDPTHVQVDRNYADTIFFDDGSLDRDSSWFVRLEEWIIRNYLGDVQSVQSMIRLAEKSLTPPLNDPYERPDCTVGLRASRLYWIVWTRRANESDQPDDVFESETAAIFEAGIKEIVTHIKETDSKFASSPVNNVGLSRRELLTKSAAGAALFATGGYPESRKTSNKVAVFVIDSDSDLAPEMRGHVVSFRGVSHGDIIKRIIFDEGHFGEFYNDNVDNERGEVDLKKYLTVLRGISRYMDQNRSYNAVINISLGSFLPNSTEEQIIKELISKGAIIVASAGNKGLAHASFPAAYEGVIGVAAAQYGKRSPYSNFGTGVDIVAEGRYTYQQSFYTRDNKKYTRTITVYGTSFAAPRITAAISTLFFHAWIRKKLYDRDYALTQDKVLAYLKEGAMSMHKCQYYKAGGLGFGLYSREKTLAQVEPHYGLFESPDSIVVLVTALFSLLPNILALFNVTVGDRERSHFAWFVGMAVGAAIIVFVQPLPNLFWVATVGVFFVFVIAPGIAFSLFDKEPLKNGIVFVLRWPILLATLFPNPLIPFVRMLNKRFEILSIFYERKIDFNLKIRRRSRLKKRLIMRLSLQIGNSGDRKIIRKLERNLEWMLKEEEPDEELRDSINTVVEKMKSRKSNKQSSPVELNNNRIEINTQAVRGHRMHPAQIVTELIKVRETVRERFVTSSPAESSLSPKSLPRYLLLVDIAFLLVFGIPALILIPVFAVMVAINLGEWPFFTQERLGRKGRIIKITKIKTMDRDRRKTRFTEWLRDCGFDELPQLLLVAKRQLTIYGMRPRPREQMTSYYLENELDYRDPGFISLSAILFGTNSGWMTPKRIEWLVIISLIEMNSWSFVYMVRLTWWCIQMIAYKKLLNKSFAKKAEVIRREFGIPELDETVQERREGLIDVAVMLFENWQAQISIQAHDSGSRFCREGRYLYQLLNNLKGFGVLFSAEDIESICERTIFGSRAPPEIDAQARERVISALQLEFSPTTSSPVQESTLSLYPYTVGPDMQQGDIFFSKIFDELASGKRASVSEIAQIYTGEDLELPKIARIISMNRGLACVTAVLICIEVLLILTLFMDLILLLTIVAAPLMVATICCVMQSFKSMGFEATEDAPGWVQDIADCISEYMHDRRYPVMVTKEPNLAVLYDPNKRQFVISELTLETFTPSDLAYFIGHEYVHTRQDPRERERSYYIKRLGQLEADIYGFLLARAIGYNPNAAMTLSLLGPRGRIN